MILSLATGHYFMQLYYLESRMPGIINYKFKVLKCNNNVIL